MISYFENDLEVKNFNGVSVITFLAHNQFDFDHVGQTGKELCSLLRGFFDKKMVLDWSNISHICAAGFWELL